MKGKRVGGWFGVPVSIGGVRYIEVSVWNGQLSIENFATMTASF